MKNVTVIDHPLVATRLAALRDESTPNAEFRKLLDEVSQLLAYEATRELETKAKTVRTPLAKAKGSALKRQVVLVPIVRAGLGMLDAALRLVPEAHVGFLGLRRDEKTLEPHTYLSTLPKNLRNADVLLLDPMLATGGSAIAALDQLKLRKAQRVTMVNLLVAPEGVRRVHKDYPEVNIFTASIDEKLNDIGYIFPGLGDAGDRQFGPQ